MVLSRRFQCVTKIVFSNTDAVHSQYREHCLLRFHELRPDGTHRDLIGHERLSGIHEQADLEESRVAVNAKAVIVELKLVLFLPLAMGGRQQFSCRCSGRSMVHWNPPRRKTEIETSKRLQTPRRSIGKSEIQNYKVKKMLSFRLD